MKIFQMRLFTQVTIKIHFPLKSPNFGFISFAHLVISQITEYNDGSRNGSSPKGNKHFKDFFY